LLLRRYCCGGTAEESELQAVILDALEKKKSGDGTNFTSLVEAIEAPGDGSEQVKLIQCLSRCTASLHKKAHSSLITATLSTCWRGNAALLAAAEIFANNCVSANAELLHPVLSTLVKKFTEFPAPPALPTSASHHALSELATPAPTTPRAPDATTGRDLHRLLASILSTFPTATSCLLPLLRDSFPHRRRPAEDQRRYVGHLLRVVTAVPQLFEQVFEELIDRLLQATPPRPLPCHSH
jgi:hypothetical protein